MIALKLGAPQTRLEGGNHRVICPEVSAKQSQGTQIPGDTVDRTVTAVVAARLEEDIDSRVPHFAYIARPFFQTMAERPHWDIERARVRGTREVPVEVIQNGRVVARTRVAADGTAREISFDLSIGESSWIALRILPSSHTNPVFVEIGGKPIRASRQSVEWCLQSVDRCWEQKSPRISEAEWPQAKAAYDHARAAYRQNTRRNRR